MEYPTLMSIRSEEIETISYGYHSYSQDHERYIVTLYERFYEYNLTDNTDKEDDTACIVYPYICHTIIDEIENAGLQYPCETHHTREITEYEGER